MFSLCFLCGISALVRCLCETVSRSCKMTSFFLTITSLFFRQDGEIRINLFKVSSSFFFFLHRRTCFSWLGLKSFWICLLPISPLGRRRGYPREKSLSFLLLGQGLDFNGSFILSGARQCDQAMSICLK